MNLYMVAQASCLYFAQARCLCHYNWTPCKKYQKQLSTVRRQGGTPLASPRQRAQRTKVPNNLLSCANRPYIACRSYCGVHVAIVLVHVPRVRRTARVGSTRPVVARPHADKGVTTRSTGSFPTRLTGLGLVRNIDQAYQLIPIWQTPITRLRTVRKAC